MTRANAPSAETPRLIVGSISKSFGDKAVLKEVSFNVRGGDFVAILGTSGAGKTTLLRCITGLERPDSGGITLQTGTASTPSERIDPRKLSVIFQDLNLVRRLSAIENVIAVIADELTFPERLLRLYRKTTLERAFDALSRVGIGRLAHTRADRLSGGEQQRVAIARALVRQSALIIADEPVASLDERTARDVLALLRSVGELTGAAIVCSLHQVDLAREFADRLVGLRHGELQFDGPTSEISRAEISDIYAIASRDNATFDRHSNRARASV